jgi:hypothetical protein
MTSANPANSAPEPTTVIATYRVRADKEPEFRRLLERHHPTLKRLGLVTNEPPVIYRGTERGGGPIVFEIFTWKDAAAPGKAHEHPEVMAIWEPMGALVEDRKSGPKFDFPQVERLALGR